MNKIKTIQRLIQNRLRFRNNYIKKDGSYYLKLDTTCLCGLEPGDKFKNKKTSIEITPDYMIKITRNL